ncbi:MAG: ethanolamine ammonia-lyase subunit EutC [Cytophagales bacterium]|nr:MAG: ethanolamine ammonia-lyase subunit EutC [Cytophagales bacterium]
MCLNNTPKKSADLLRNYNDARIDLGLAGISIPTKEMLKFNVDLALAKDAVHTELNFEEIANNLSKMGFNPLLLASEASSKEEYLQRPDLGRKLSATSTDLISKLAIEKADIGFVVCDGLAANAIATNAVSFIQLVTEKLQTSNYTFSRLSLVKYGRVAIGDPIGSLLGSKIVIVLIGERPGLSATDSMGVYFTYKPELGKTDHQRNCISNIRPKGLPIEYAADKLCYLIHESFRLKLSGVDLKDNFESMRLSK